MGNLLSEVEYKNDSSIGAHIDNVYDMTGNLVSSIEYTANGSIKKHLEYTYDTAGNVLSETSTDITPNAVPRVEQTIIYEYN